MSKKNRQSHNSSRASIKRRVAYSLAAGAAAGAASQARAAIVYSGLQNINVGQFGSQTLDLNLDTQPDIKLENYVFGGGNYQGALASTSPGKLVGFTSGFSYASALSAARQSTVQRLVHLLVRWPTEYTILTLNSTVLRMLTLASVSRV